MTEVYIDPDTDESNEPKAPIADLEALRGRLVGQAWESFLIQNKKAGLIHRLTTVDGDTYSTDLLTAFDLGGKPVLIKHSCSYHIDSAINWTHYEYRQGREETVAAVKGDEIIVQTPKGKSTIPRPENGIPSYLYHAILMSMELEEGARFEFTELTDSNPAEQSQVRYKCIGAEELTVNGGVLPIWIYGQKTGRKRGNTFWLDGDHQIVKSDWSGASSVLVSGVEAAFEGLPPKLIGQIETFLSE